MLQRFTAPVEELDAERLREFCASRPDVIRIADAVPREDITVVGEISSLRIVPRAGSPSLEATIYDGSGSVVVTWTGRRRIAGVAAGRRLVVSGRVLTPDCKPAANALLDFWHADENGDYDNRGFRYRGHQFTDAEGRYRLETILPAVYPGRTRHIHVKVQPAGGRILTTQLYFPNERENERDGLFRRELVMQMADRGQGAFDFVIA